MIDKSKKTYNAIILAAGYGSRLAPVTDEIPKPLIPVGDRTLLENILFALEKASVAKFAVNTHHLGEQIKQAVKDSTWSKKVVLYPEDEILGTGGPLVNAKEMLADCDAFILHNGDILTDIDFKALIGHHETAGCPITMVMIDGPENKVAVNENGIVVDILGKLGRKGDNRKMTYTGIAMFSPEIFKYLPSEVENCSIITAILAAMKDNPHAVSAYSPNLKSLDHPSSRKTAPDKPNHNIIKSPNHQIYWNDLGTVEKFLDAQHDIAGGKIVLPSLIPGIPMLMFPLPYPGGSDRMFFRMDKSASKPDNDKASKIIMCASKDSADFERFLSIGKFLDSQKLGVPEIYNFSIEKHVVIMEDLGDDILYNRLRTGVSNQKKEDFYRKVIEWLVRFQSKTYGKYCPEGENRPEKVGVRLFDFDYLRWETSYFAENFLINYCGLRKEDVDKLDCEFRKLAEEALKQPQVLIHRDFQSQNILFKDKKVRIVDFQGARIGNIAYDLMSLLKDPYVALSKKLRTSLIDYYYELFRQSDLAKTIKFSREEFAKFAATAALQRNMQALGAYGFLGLKKGKKEYLQHIPTGLEYLKDGLMALQSYNPACQLPKLTEMVL